MLLKVLAKTIIQALTVSLRATVMSKAQPVSPVITAPAVPLIPATLQVAQTMPQLILPSVPRPVLLFLSPLTSIIQTILLPPRQALSLAAAPRLALIISSLLIPVTILAPVPRPVTVPPVTLIAPMCVKLRAPTPPIVHQAIILIMRAQLILL